MKRSIKPIKILHLEDIQKDIEQVRNVLKNSNMTFDVKVVNTVQDYELMLTEFAPEIIISNNVRSLNSIEALAIMNKMKLEIPMIITAPAALEPNAIESVQGGAYDYVLKDRLHHLPIVINNALKKIMIEKELKLIEENFSNLIQILPPHVFLPDNKLRIPAQSPLWNTIVDEDDPMVRYHIQ